MKGKYKFWCYNNGSGTTPIINSVEITIEAFSEEIAFKNVKDHIKRDVYNLLTVDFRVGEGIDQ